MKHSFVIGQEIYWHVTDFETNRYIKAVVTEVTADHCIALSQGNHNNYDDMHLWIDSANEMDFFIMRY